MLHSTCVILYTQWKDKLSCTVFENHYLKTIWMMLAKMDTLEWFLNMYLDVFQVCGQTNGQNLQKPNGLDFWQSERPKDMANIVDLEVMCGKRHMEVAVTFDKPFNGIIFSKVT